MDNILSQDEVDALLRGISDGDIETEIEADESPDGITSYDLTSQDRIIRGRMPTLEIINDRFARLHRVSLSGLLRQVVDITVSQKEMIKFGEFIRTLPVPTSLHILKMNPLRGHILMVVESRLVFNLMDCFFGGRGRSHFKIEGRDFTSIEHRIIQKVVATALEDLQQAWKPAVPVEFQFVRSEINPQFAGIVPPSDLVIVVHLELELEQVIGKMVVCLPYSTIEPIRSTLYATYQSDQLEVDNEWIERFKKRLREVEVEVLLELGKTSIKGRELLQLDIGDILVLDQDISKTLTAKVQGVPKFLAIAGNSRGSRAFQVIEAINPPTA